MKHFQKIAAILFTVFALMFPAHAQFQLPGEDKVLVLCQPTTLRTDGLSKGITNIWQDIHGSIGQGMIIAGVQTNSGTGTLTLTVQTSPDQTNITTLANCLIDSTNSLAYTNFIYGYTNAPAATNLWLQSGTNVTPNAPSAGFATVYLNPNAFNSNAVVAVSAEPRLYYIGFNAGDAQRYIRTTWSATGANTNYDGINAVAILRRVQQ